MESRVDHAVQLIHESSSMVALTGAGISTDSGIPDFRSPDGLWSKYPAKFGDYNYFKAHPEQFIKMGRELLPLLIYAEPNQGHTALKDLENMGLLHAVITQNIDGLHQKAGSTTVIELHGTYKTATCESCGKKFTLEDMLSFFEESFLCPECAGSIKPDVIMFGESLPEKAFLQAARLSEKADIMLVAGSRLEVYPASRLVLVTKSNQGRIIIVNNTETALDRVADVILRENISKCLPRIVEKVKEKIS